MAESVKFSWAYSALRGELYVADWQGQQQFTVHESEVVGEFDESISFSTMTDEQIDTFLLHNYMEELQALCPFDDTIRPYGPGKYSTMLDSFIHTVAGVNCWFDGSELGDVEGFGWYSLLTDIPADTVMECMKDIPIFAGESMTGGEYEFLKANPHAIVHENSQGFVYFEYYETKKQAEKVWAKLEEEHDKWEHENNEEEFEEYAIDYATDDDCKECGRVICRCDKSEGDEETCPQCNLLWHACHCGEED